MAASRGWMVNKPTPREQRWFSKSWFTHRATTGTAACPSFTEFSIFVGTHHSYITSYTFLSAGYITHFPLWPRRKSKIKLTTKLALLRLHFFLIIFKLSLIRSKVRFFPQNFSFRPLRSHTLTRQKTALGRNNLYERSHTTVTGNRSKVKVTDSSTFWSLSFVEPSAKPMDTAHKNQSPKNLTCSGFGHCVNETFAEVRCYAGNIPGGQKISDCTVCKKWSTINTVSSFESWYKHRCSIWNQDKKCQRVHFSRRMSTSNLYGIFS